MPRQMQMGGGDDEGMSELYETPKREGSRSEEAGETVDQEEREQMDTTATIPLAVITHGGRDADEAPKVGDRCVFEITDINGDMATIKYSDKPPTEPGEMGEEGEGEGEGGDYQTADEELDELGKKY